MSVIHKNMIFILKKYDQLFRAKIDSEDTVYPQNSVVLAGVRFVYYLFKSFGKRKAYKGNVIYCMKKNVDISSFYDVDREIASTGEMLTKYDIRIGVGDFLRYLLKLPGYLMQMYMHRDIVRSEVRYDCLVANVVVDQLLRNGVERVLFNGFAYRFEMTAVSVLAREKGLNTLYFSDLGFVSESDSVVADTIIVRNDLHAKYIRKYGKAFEYDNIKVMGSIPVTNALQTDDRKIIGVFPSGFYARYKLKDNADDFLKKGEKAEGVMLEVVKNFSSVNPDVDVRIYPHYYAGIENYHDAINYYQDILSLDNVTLVEEGVDSQSDFQQISLGVTSISTVFFDMLERGHKCCLIGCYVEMCGSGFLDAFIARTELDLNDFLSMNKEDFFDRYRDA